MALGLGACASNNIIIDDWGIAGYARLRGTVTHADGSPYGGIVVRYGCGAPTPDWFGGTAMTDAQGAFDVVAAWPMAGTLPTSGTPVCQVRAPDGAAAWAAARLSTPFSESAGSPPVTTFTLVEGQGI